MKVKTNKAAIKRGKERAEREDAEGEERTKRQTERLAQFQKHDKKRSRIRHGAGMAGALVGTSGEGGKFKLMGGMHIDRETGITYGKYEEGGEFIESDLPLDELFDNKFIRVGGQTMLGRDRRRDKIDSNVMDRPKVWEADEEQEHQETELEEDESDIHNTMTRKQRRAMERKRAAEVPADEAEAEDDEAEAESDRPRKGRKGRKKSRE